MDSKRKYELDVSLFGFKTEVVWMFPLVWPGLDWFSNGSKVAWSGFEWSRSCLDVVLSGPEVVSNGPKVVWTVF